MIDTHCHLFKEHYEDLDDLINTMKNENISAICNGCESKTNEEVIMLSKKYENIYAACGFHPEDIDLGYSKEELINNIDNIVAIGEIGLDYHYRVDNKDEQKKLLEMQLSVAAKYNKPVIVHIRDAMEDAHNIISKYKVKGVIHAFSGSYEMAIKFIKLGFKLGIGGVITFKNCKLKEVIEKIDISNILLETDSPYLTPEPNRGKINSPLNLKYIAKFLSDLYNIPYDDVIKITSKNAKKVFNIR